MLGQSSRSRPARRLPPRGAGAAALLAFICCAAQAGALPDRPAVDRDVSLTRGDDFLHPHIPPLRTTADGRVGISPKPIGGMLRFYALVPEHLRAPFVAGPPGDEILAGITPYEVPETRFHGSTDRRRRHYALCDPTSEFHTAGETTSPYACGHDGRDDCYDFVVITSARLGTADGQRQLWGTPVSVRVTRPKTAEAAIDRVITGPRRAGPIHAVGSFFEPMTTNDGRLLSGRVATPDFEWTPAGSGETRRHFVDLVYSFNANGRPCDVDQWHTFYPISHAPYDPDVKSRYGFAMAPFRDSTGALLPDGADLGISYPWIDRHGDNLFFTSVGATLSIDGLLPAGPAGNTRYPTRCAPGSSCTTYVEFFDWTRGQAVAGLWTHGKMVQLDGLLNNTDYGIEVADGAHRLVHLYRDGSGPKGTEPGEVRIGSGRGSADHGGPATYVGNANFVDSTENLFHALPALHPVSPRDVTWIVNSGKASDEIAFDDWLDLDAFIVSEMVGATSYVGPPDGAGVMTYHDGWMNRTAMVQNAATSLPDRWQVPVAGVAFGDVRIEPVALGGVRGKGLWLDGDAGLEYPIDEQGADMRATAWYVGIFLDARFEDDDLLRALVVFADGSRIALLGRRGIHYVAGDGTTTQRVDLATPLPHGAWTHLGFQLHGEDGGVTLYRDGFPLHRVDGDAGLRFTAGSLLVGADPRDDAGVRGWIDDLVVFAREMAAEAACNQAAGSLVAVDESAAPQSWIDTARSYPDWAHARVRADLGGRGPAAAERFVCFHGYERDHQHHLADLPAGLVSVRRELVFPEGPLVFGQPRPDSSRNPFCLTCHSAAGMAGLSLAALVPDPARAMEDDRRRQPSQPPRRVFGSVPAHWLGPGKPPRHVQAPPAGLKVDALLAGAIVPAGDGGPGRGACPGDCDGDSSVSVGELVVAVRIALGDAPFGMCRTAFDCGSADNCLGIAQVVAAVRHAVDGCPAAPASR